MYFPRPCLRWLAPAVIASVLLVTTACGSRKTSAVAIPTAPASDNSYRDLAAGERIRIIVPVGNTIAAIQDGSATVANGGTQVMSPGLVGYRTVYYLVRGTRQGRVRLEFESSHTSWNGDTVRDSIRPRLSFRLPVGANYVRLKYLVRQSAADHNMAILAAKHVEILNTFTERFRNDPSLCDQRGEVECVWVPLGVGLRTERQSQQ
jgi:hypothetical protein